MALSRKAPTVCQCGKLRRPPKLRFSAIRWVNRTYVRRLLKASITHKHDTAGHASASLLRCYGHAGPSLNSRAALGVDNPIELIWIVQCIGFPGFGDSVHHHLDQTESKETIIAT